MKSVTTDAGVDDADNVIVSASADNGSSWGFSSSGSGRRLNSFCKSRLILIEKIVNKCLVEMAYLQYLLVFRAYLFPLCSEL